MNHSYNIQNLKNRYEVIGKQVVAQNMDCRSGKLSWPVVVGRFDSAMFVRYEELCYFIKIFRLFKLF